MKHLDVDTEAVQSGEFKPHLCHAITAIIATENSVYVKTNMD